MTSRRGDNDDALSFGSPLRDELPRRRYYRSFNDRSTPRIECAVYPLVHTSFNYVEGGFFFVERFWDSVRQLSSGIVYFSSRKGWIIFAILI